MDLFRGLGRTSGSALVALRAEPEKLRFVHADSATADGPVVHAFGETDCAGDSAALAQAYRALGINRRLRCAMQLSLGEYQISAVEAPNVPQAELKTAMRWRMKDVIDYPVEQAVFDVLEIPADDSAPGRAKWIYVVAARSDLIRGYVQRFDDAKLPLGIIDIPETAQRNVAVLYEPEGRGVGFLHFDEAGGLLTITSGGELYLARRLDFKWTEIKQANEAYREDLFGRILVELQRTLDNFERQHSRIVLSRILVGPEPEPTPLAAYLQSNLAVEVTGVALEDVIDFRGPAPDARTQWAYFHLIGCAIRSEAKPQ